MSRNPMSVPLYEVVKSRILEKIRSGELPPSSKVPSEHELVKEFGVSRMTANRALKELTAEGLLTRVAGVGTFVVQAQTTGHLLEVRNIADDVRERGNDYDMRIVSHQKVRPPREVSAWMGIDSRSKVYRTVIVHLENDTPIQLEDRFVSPIGAPTYSQIDLGRETPTKFLLANVPLQRVEHTVRAVMPDPRTQDLLEIGAETPCLLLNRRTWSQEIPVSCVDLSHSGEAFALSDSFVPRRQ